MDLKMLTEGDVQNRNNTTNSTDAVRVELFILLIVFTTHQRDLKIHKDKEDGRNKTKQQPTGGTVTQQRTCREETQQ